MTCLSTWDKDLSFFVPLPPMPTSQWSPTKKEGLFWKAKMKMPSNFPLKRGIIIIPQSPPTMKRESALLWIVMPKTLDNILIDLFLFLVETNPFISASKPFSSLLINLWSKKISRVGHWNIQDKKPELIDGEIDKLVEKALAADPDTLLPSGSCHNCKKIAPLNFLVKGKEGVPKWKFCSSGCIRKEFMVTKAKGWTEKTNSKGSQSSQEGSSKKKKKN